MQVQPRYINQPKNPQGKYGNIKMADNTLLWVPRTHLGWFQEGQIADVEVETQKWGQMGEVPVVCAVNGHSIKTNALAPAPAPVQPPSPGPAPSPAPPRPVAPAAPMPPDMAQERASAEEKKSESIFITGVVQQAVSGGHCGLMDVSKWAQAAALAWRLRHGDPQRGMVPPDLGDYAGHDPNDEIPL